MHIREYLHCLVTLDAFDILNEESSYTINRNAYTV